MLAQFNIFVYIKTDTFTYFLLFLYIFKVCYARILDLKRRFLEAALRYYDISQIEQRQIGDE